MSALLTRHGHLAGEGWGLSLIVPATLATLLLATLALQLGFLVPANDGPVLPVPELVTIAAGRFNHRLDGEYYRRGFAVDAPKVEISMPDPLQIMKYQVSAADYDLCSRAGVCAPREPGHSTDAGAEGMVAATGVSFDDATAYAGWLSRRTGETFTLPDDKEWAYAAGDVFVDDALGIDPGNANPSLRWLADYERESARKAATDPTPKPQGHYGINEHGVADMTGNIWEWTTTCQRRVDLDRAGTGRAEDIACGIYVVEGRHRSPMSAFIRDPKTGGCSVGAPPDNLGFRLVRRPGWIEHLKARMGL